MLKNAFKTSKQITALFLLVLGIHGGAWAQSKLQAGTREAGEGNLPKSACQWSERTPNKTWACTGMIGLLRLSRNGTVGNDPVNRKHASSVLFGSEELPAIGSEIVIKRSAHLRHEYWPERDDQDVSKGEKICLGIGCRDNWRKGDCGKSVGEFSFYSRLVKRQSKYPEAKGIQCPGPTDGTDYFAAGTVVKILGYQQMGAFFVLVQIIKVESIFPLDDEKKYEFDHREII